MTTLQVLETFRATITGRIESYRAQIERRRLTEINEAKYIGKLETAEYMCCALDDLIKEVLSGK